jgi:hypothetical protein
LTFGGSGSDYCSCAWRTVRQGHADSPRGADRSGVHRVLRVFVRARVLIHFVRCFWLLVVCQTVYEVSANGLFRVDGPWVGHEQSIFWGAVLEVRGLFSDGPPRPCGRPGPCGKSAPSLAELLSLLLLELRFHLGFV